MKFPITPIDNVDGGTDLEQEEEKEYCPLFMHKADLFLNCLTRGSTIVLRHPYFSVSIDDQMTSFSGCSSQTYHLKNKPIN